MMLERVVQKQKQAILFETPPPAGSFAPALATTTIYPDRHTPKSDFPSHSQTSFNEIETCSAANRSQPSCQLLRPERSRTRTKPQFKIGILRSVWHHSSSILFLSISCLSSLMIHLSSFKFDHNDCLNCSTMLIVQLVPRTLDPPRKEALL
jgi:hypothetical protein